MKAKIKGKKECSLEDCPPGFFMFKGYLCFKTEYGVDEVYCGDSGEVFWGGVHTKEDRLKLVVTPVRIKIKKNKE